MPRDPKAENPELTSEAEEPNHADSRARRIVKRYFKLSGLKNLKISRKNRQGSGTAARETTEPSKTESNITAESGASHGSQVTGRLCNSDRVDEIPSDDADDADDDSQYARKLVRKSLVPFLETMQWPPSSSPDIPTAELLHYTSGLLTMMLEVSGDLLLADFFRAIVDIEGEVASKEGQQADTNVEHSHSKRMASTIHKFLQHTVGIFRLYIEGDQSAGHWDKVAKAFYHILEEFVRQSELDEEQHTSQCLSPETSSSAHSSSDCDPSVTIAVEGCTTEIPFDGVLSCFWGTSLDTACHACQKPFVDEPPIRTVSPYESIKALARNTVQARVHNRHFSCLRGGKISYVPISHVWDDSIREANATGKHNQKAASTMISTLSALLKNMKEAYPPGVELWHDYFSVPQWEPRIKESLLISLPAIYHSANEILIHMADVTSYTVEEMLEPNIKPVTISEAFSLFPLVNEFCRSQWWERMWVTLEYSQCKKACVMDASNRIWRDKGSNGVMGDTFTQVLHNATKRLNHLRPYLSSLHRIIFNETGIFHIRDIHQDSVSIGSTLQLVRWKKCFEFRDRFLAIHVISNPGNMPGEAMAIPEHATDACLQVWRSALTKGDFSPLLLQPCERIDSSNPPADCPSWIVGYHSLDGAEWGLGLLRTPAQTVALVKERTVQVELELVGQIEAIHFMYENTEERHSTPWHISPVLQAVQLLLSLTEREGFTLSPEMLAGTFSRIFPALLTFHPPKDGTSSRNPQELEPDLYSRLQNELRVFVGVAHDESASDQRINAIKEIIAILGLNRPFDKPFETQSRLRSSMGLASGNKDRGCPNGEPIAEVRCPGCRAVNLFRLDLRDNGRKGDTVYRIPGLGYGQTVENGVGLVMRDGRITGRMLYGTPACNCHIPELVEIG